MTPDLPASAAAPRLPSLAAVPSRRQRARQDAAATLLGLASLMAWDASGVDLAMVRLFGGSHGFVWRDNWLTRSLLHDGGRLLAAVVLAAVVLSALRAPRAGAPSRALRWHWVGVMLLCLVAVPAIKRLSLTSCPWSLAEFGGAAHYLSHWRWGLGDGGPGHCFPSGHAVAAFAFLGLHFLWRDHAPARARAWLWAVMAAGLFFGAAQMARGAHYPSHTLWSAWLCWLVCVSAYHLGAPGGMRAALAREP